MKAIFTILFLISNVTLFSQKQDVVGNYKLILETKDSSSFEYELTLSHDGKFSFQDVSNELNIPKQYISKVLNEHMKTNFQDFINEYRVEEFIKRLKNDQNNQFTLLGIAIGGRF